MEGDTTIVEMFHNLSIFKQAALFRSKNIMQRGARQWRLISRSGQADAGTHLQPLLTGPNQGTMFTAAKAAATGKEIEGLKNGGFAGPIGTDQPIEMGMDINVYAVQVPQASDLKVFNNHDMKRGSATPLKAGP